MREWGARRGWLGVDATSPVDATRSFRRRSVRGRAACLSDDYLATTLAAEDALDSVAVSWLMSQHVERKRPNEADGSYTVNQAADALCQMAAGRSIIEDAKRRAMLRPDATTRRSETPR